MNQEEKKIKKYYGEKMLQGLYQLFPTIMEEPGVMFRLLESHFAFNKFLFDDMVRNHCLVSFKQFILDKFQENEA